MNKLLLCLLLATVSSRAVSQKVYFVYLQSEQDQPFFVKMEEKIHSSTASGYLILSRLKDTTYSFTIGFPQNKYPEQKFSVQLRSKDHGYLLKNFGEKGWGLFDLQTLSVQMAILDNKVGAIKTEIKEVSAFTDVLARAADDPSLREKPVFVAKVEEKKPEEKPVEVVKKEEPSAVVPEPAVSRNEVPVKESPKEPVVVKTTEIREQPAVKPAGEKTGIKEAEGVKEERKETTIATPVVKPVEVVEQPAVKIGEIRTEEKVPDESKKEDKKEATAEPIAKPVEVIEQPPVKIGERVAETKEGISRDVIVDTVSAPGKAEGDAPVLLVEKKRELARSLEEYSRSTVTKLRENPAPEGISLTYIDQEADGAADTITIIIPETKPVVTEMKESPKEDRKFLDISTEPADTMKSIPSTVKQEQPVAKAPVVKNNCRELADENDFLKLRKKMVSETDDDDMVDEARKYFKTKCFSTAQIRNLGVLFLDDLGKYKFFDMAYLFVSDTENFPSLQSELKGEYYINRFKAMLK